VEAYLHDHIPLTRAMGVAVEAAGAEGVVLSAPLEPNLNHRDTVFGGSASALAILSGWTLVHLRLRDEGLHPRIVIQRNEMEYLRPIEDRFTATCTAPPPEAWDRLLRTLKGRGMGRVEVRAALECGEVEVGRFSGQYVALEGEYAT